MVTYREHLQHLAYTNLITKRVVSKYTRTLWALEVSLHLPCTYTDTVSHTSTVHGTTGGSPRRHSQQRRTRDIYRVDWRAQYIHWRRGIQILIWIIRSHPHTYTHTVCTHLKLHKATRLCRIYYHYLVLLAIIAIQVAIYVQILYLTFFSLNIQQWNELYRQAKDNVSFWLQNSFSSKDRVQIRCFSTCFKGLIAFASPLFQSTKTNNKKNRQYTKTASL